MGKKSFNTGMIPLSEKKYEYTKSMKLRGVGPYTFDYLWYGNATEENEYWGLMMRFLASKKLKEHGVSYEN